MKINYTGFRSIGARPSVRTIESLRELSNKVIELANQERYRKAAIEAVRSGEMRVYLPASLTEQSIDGFFAKALQMMSFGNTNGEPTYASLEAGRSGQNDDGSSHNGFLVIDVLERVVIDLVNNDGTTRLATPLVRFATPERVMIE